MTGPRSRSRTAARLNLDHVDKSTDAGGERLGHEYAIELLLTGIGYALLDVADAIRTLAKTEGTP